MTSMIHIDGSRGEGGGQMVRSALALSTLTGIPFRMTNIRANRPKAGLKAQHLQAIRALYAICSAKTNEVGAGSRELTFFPGPVRPGEYFFDIGTAGSISLLLQALLPPLLFAPGTTTLVLRGGTCGKWQPPVEYTQWVLLPYLDRFAKIRLELIRRGYYPKGGGEVKVTIHPRQESWQSTGSLPPYQLTGNFALQKIGGIAFATDALRDRRVAERMIEGAEKEIRHWNVALQLTPEYGPALNPGAGIVLWAEGLNTPETGLPLRLGADALGARGKPAEDVGREVARKLNRTLGAGTPVDEHLADQLIPYLGLLPGSSLKTPLPTGHFLSNITITERFLPVRFTQEKTIFKVSAG